MIDSIDWIRYGEQSSDACGSSRTWVNTFFEKHAYRNSSKYEYKSVVTRGYNLKIYNYCSYVISDDVDNYKKDCNICSVVLIAVIVLPTSSFVHSLCLLFFFLPWGSMVMVVMMVGDLKWWEPFLYERMWVCICTIWNSSRRYCYHWQRYCGWPGLCCKLGGGPCK